MTYDSFDNLIHRGFWLISLFFLCVLPGLVGLLFPHVLLWAGITISVATAIKEMDPQVRSCVLLVEWAVMFLLLAI